MSSLFSIKEASHSKSWKDVLPANSPSVTSFNSLSSTIKSSNNLSHREKKVILSDKKSSQYQSHEVIDLTDFSVMDEQPNKGLLVGCAAEKRKLSSTEHASAKFMRNSFGSSSASPSESNDLSFKICPVKSEASPSDIRVVQKDIVPSSSRPNNSHTTQKMGSESVKQNEKIIKCVPVHPGDEEAKGSDFLSQVTCNKRTLSLSHPFIYLFSSSSSSSPLDSIRIPPLEPNSFSTLHCFFVLLPSIYNIQNLNLQAYSKGTI